MAELTVLHNSSSRLCKVISRNSDAETVIASYDKATTFLVEQRIVHGIEELSDLLTILQHDSHRLIIRGTPHPDMDESKPVRRRGYFPNIASISEAPFQDQPQPWLMLDIDKLTLPPSIDVLREPLKAIAFAIEQLPAAFHNVTVHWQLSASAGIRDTGQVSAHLFYWLVDPLTSQRLK